jgi:hypothetical protein
MITITARVTNNSVGRLLLGIGFHAMFMFKPLQCPFQRVDSECERGYGIFRPRSAGSASMQDAQLRIALFEIQRANSRCG